jgi:hypothetical protein
MILPCLAAGSNQDVPLPDLHNPLAVAGACVVSPVDRNACRRGPKGALPSLPLLLDYTPSGLMSR